MITWVMPENESIYRLYYVIRDSVIVWFTCLISVIGTNNIKYIYNVIKVSVEDLKVDYSDKMHGANESLLR